MKVRLEAPKQDPRFTEPRDVWAVYVTEPRPPKGIEPLEWMLLTSPPTDTAEEAQGSRESGGSPRDGGR